MDSQFILDEESSEIDYKEVDAFIDSLDQQELIKMQNRLQQMYSAVKTVQKFIMHTYKINLEISLPYSVMPQESRDIFNKLSDEEKADLIVLSDRFIDFKRAAAWADSVVMLIGYAQSSDRKNDRYLIDGLNLDCSRLMTDSNGSPAELTKKSYQIICSKFKGAVQIYNDLQYNFINYVP